MLRFGSGETQTDVSLKYSWKTRADVFGVSRDAMLFCVEGQTYESVKALFADDAQYGDTVQQITYETVTDEESGEQTVNEVTNEVVTDLSEFCIAGDITDKRDGTFTVVMGKKSDSEIEIENLEIENAALLYENLTGGEFVE